MSDVFKQLMGNNPSNNQSNDLTGYPNDEGMTPEIQKEVDNAVNTTLLTQENRAFIKVHKEFDGGNRIFTKAGKKMTRKWQGKSCVVKIPQDLSNWLARYAAGLSNERAIISLMYYAQKKMQENQDFIEYLD